MSATHNAIEMARIKLESTGVFKRSVENYGRVGQWRRLATKYTSIGYEYSGLSRAVFHLKRCRKCY